MSNIGFGHFSGSIALFGVDQCGDLDQVVIEDAVTAPDPGTVEPVNPRPAPTEVSFEAADPSFASGSPFHEPLECWLLLDDSPCGARFAFGRKHNGGHANVP
jgi:hypothetical protein